MLIQPVPVVILAVIAAVCQSPPGTGVLKHWDTPVSTSVRMTSEYRPAIIEAVNLGVQLLDGNGPRPLHGMMLSPVVSHDAPQAPADQLVIMGRFVLTDTEVGAANKNLTFRVGLFGKTPEEQLLTITATQKAESGKHKFALTPGESEVVLFLAK